MIKIFRNIRQKLLQEGKSANYLKYAIGEIVLVVIGILLALQVNNWNENQNNLKLVEETIASLETELIHNFNEATFVLGFWNNQDKICKDVIFDQVTHKDYRNNDLIGIVVGNWYSYDPKAEILNLLLENEKLANKKLKPIIDIAKELKKSNTFLDQNWNILRENIEANIDKLTNRVSLVRLDSISQNERYEYMLNDPDYKKIVELYWTKASNYYDFISRNRALNMATLSTIKIVQDGYDKEKLEDLYKLNEMHPFIPIECANNDFERNQELRRSYLIGNLSDKNITIRMINDGKIGGTYKLKPNELRESRAEFAGLGGDYTVIAEQIDSNGNCVQKFLAVNKGYLLID